MQKGASTFGTLALPYPIVDAWRVYFRASNSHEVIRFVACRSEGRARSTLRQLPNSIVALSNRGDRIMR
jgi:hypothetical protein